MRPAVLCLSCTLCLFLLAGCNEEPTPTPTPTPSPSPTVTPSPTPTPDSSAFSAFRAGDESSLVEQVASTNAAILEMASRDAADAALQFERAVALLVASPSQAAFDDAVTDLAMVQVAFSRAEPAVFYPDINSAEELSALPDPIAIDKGKLVTRFEVLRGLLGEYSADSSAAASLVTESQALTTALQTFADSWSAGGEANFRNAFFLSSADEAAGRILQGLISLSGGVLAQRVVAVSPDGSGFAVSGAEMSVSLSGLNDLYVGQYQDANGNLISGTGIEALINSSDESTGQSVKNTFFQALDVASQLENSPNDGGIRLHFASAMNDLSSQLKMAASGLAMQSQ